MSAWDSEEWRAERNEHLLKWLRGDHQALAFVLTVSQIAETWDDLIDRDQPITADAVNRAFSLALVELPVNQFYRTHEGMLYPLIATAINAWLDANALELSTERARREAAFHLRNFGHEITLMAIRLVGGWEHLRSVSLEVRLYFAHEDFEGWISRHGTVAA